MHETGVGGRVEWKGGISLKCSSRRLDGGEEGGDTDSQPAFRPNAVLQVFFLLLAGARDRIGDASCLLVLLAIMLGSVFSLARSESTNWRKVRIFVGNGQLYKLCVLLGRRSQLESHKWPPLFGFVPDLRFGGGGTSLAKLEQDKNAWKK